MQINIQPKELSQHITGEDGEGRVRIIDIRDGDDYAAGHIPGALHIPLLRLVYKPDFVPDEQAVIVYTNGTAEDQEDSRKAVQMLKEHGIQAQILEGGLAAWVKAGYPVEYE